jgi:hypothetical protein
LRSPQKQGRFYFGPEKERPMIKMIRFSENARFDLGQTSATPDAIQAMISNRADPLSLLARHQSADWGDVSDGDKKLNDAAISHENDPEKRDRVLSAYELKDGTKIWIITEHDRSASTILLPEDY